jgi:hypothetical protein
MYVVLLDPEVLPAHNVFADSAKQWAVGSALTAEFIPRPKQNIRR